MAIKSLNETYDRNELFYMCNACGEVNDPSIPGDMGFHQPEEVMTPEEQQLYENYWAEGAGCCMYVLRIKERAAMGLCYLFDTGWVKDVLDERPDVAKPVADEDIKQVWMPRVFAAVSKAAEAEIQGLAPGCDIYLGDWTDPDGHEMLVVVPYEKRDQIEGIAEKLYDAVYEVVKNLF